jgi:hypothetical protein
MAGTLVTLTSRRADCLLGMRGMAARCFLVMVTAAACTRSGKSAGHSVCALPDEARALCGGRSSVRRMVTSPASWG